MKMDVDPDLSFDIRSNVDYLTGHLHLSLIDLRDQAQLSRMLSRRR